MTERDALTRRQLVARAGGYVLMLGGMAAWLPAWAARRGEPYAGGVWLSGDHHIHTKYSPDGQYEIAEQVGSAARFGLDWCVITDHGGPRHDKIALEQAYPDLLAARKRFPRVTVYQGLEWNIPSAEHGSVILPITRDEARLISNFEYLFDSRCKSRSETPPNAEEDAVAGIRYLQSLNPKPLFYANHPSRRGLDSPHEMRAWAEAGPDVARGMEGSPGHQADTFVGGLRGSYEASATKDSFPGYPPEAYRTWGGYDWYVAKVGGLWDSLLGEGRPWFITATSDSHRHWEDYAVLDSSTYATKGYVTHTGKKGEKPGGGDFFPGEYSRTYVYAARRHPMAILDAMRAGNMFTVLGGLSERVELLAHTEEDAAGMGSTLRLEKGGADVTVVLRVKPAGRPNLSGEVARLHHIDLIAGDIVGPATDRDAMTNPTTRVVAQMDAKDGRMERGMLTFRHTFRDVRSDFYVRARGTNTDVDAPKVDAPDVNPWKDLWFYTNPVFVRRG